MDGKSMFTRVMRQTRSLHLRGYSTLSYAVRGAPGLQLHQELPSMFATGLRVWPSARVLAEHVLNNDRLDVQGKRILELGAGTGAVGLACCVAGAAHVVLSDRLVKHQCVSTPGKDEPRRQLELLTKNVLLNQNLFGADTSVEVVELEFGACSSAPSSITAALQRHGPFDLVLGSDIAYSAAAYAELAQCLTQMLASKAQVPEQVEDCLRGGDCHSDPDIILAQECRDIYAISQIISAFEEAGLLARVVDKVRDVFIFQVNRPLGSQR